MNCARCGQANPSGAKFCRSCGQPLVIVPGGAAIGQGAPAPSAPVYQPPQPGAAPAADVNSITFWINEATRYGWRLWPVALLLAYIIWTKNVMVIVVGIAITWGIRRYSPKIDEALAPVWPIRNLIPANQRKILGYVVPVAISLVIGISPRLWPLLGWLPIVGPTASLTIFTALIAALAAYILVREPSHAHAR